MIIGLYNVSARTGHWPGVSWVLRSTFESSVSLRAGPAEAVPDLSAEGLAELGAKHFESACAFCHALPGQDRSVTALSMVPTPPHISDLPGDWEPQQLHWIIYEGIKLTGMPHWPAARKDEVWAVVAYLETVRSGTPPPSGTTGAGDALAYCAGCHGTEGVSESPLIPRLDLQTEAYITQSLADYRSGRRASGFMKHAVGAIDVTELATVLRHYADLPATAVAGQPGHTEAALVEKGEELARRGTDDVPACVVCHGPEPVKDNALMPRLAGQHQPYIAAQLRLWHEDGRGGGPRANLMTEAAQDLSEADIDALSAWYASLTPSPK
ncbi:c-type cytochrome [Marivita cryptomonadis]|uniref:c-type cytochrome n=1 Tax=Marivita cryptomonadis TaxID=505252 RepID=UPI000A1E6739|nr:c-type cytochrome [Marivita cryptomonadis]